MTIMAIMTNTGNILESKHVHVHLCMIALLWCFRNFRCCGSVKFQGFASYPERSLFEEAQILTISDDTDTVSISFPKFEVSHTPRSPHILQWQSVGAAHVARRSFPWIPRRMTWDIGSTQWSGMAKRWENHQGKNRMMNAWWTHDECMESSWKSGEARQGGPCWRAATRWSFCRFLSTISIYDLCSDSIPFANSASIWEILGT